MRLQSLVLAAAALALGACATETQSASASSGDRDCFLASSANGFSLVDERHVRVSVTGTRTYLLTTGGNARDLDWGQALALDGPASICTGNGLGVFLTGGEPRRRYQVTQIVREPDNAPSGS